MRWVSSSTTSTSGGTPPSSRPTITGQVGSRSSSRIASATVAASLRNSARWLAITCFWTSSASSFICACFS
jgi:hypothetical protein